ncbi:DEAD/DEAH box helicase family protein [Oxalobacter aliiformigenes]|uniref:DEAD/DEAH box helicase family protein n=1 Tax=Oxalobacter aliiformigenes TaxID=2946593 RepID=A0ABY7JK19_9BURK|nr:DEAD/DEAH box helicase family protein [Oxalobacter aliiformigenes]WAV92887.1 DEAD/DEAH box helicase family protein [Oxalobacter aliiformigenes]WAV95610.1 DEAD/DEAH box helicase family protein [Oxalobacter aliiformigenes]WAV96597.1 DEAD/DEAH box helicase family protein [Oxalobacter aliiformigenes]
MSNFDFLKAKPEFASFHEAAVAAEDILGLNPTMSVGSCRRAMEAATRWIYQVDPHCELPNDTSLFNLLDTTEFKQLVGQDLLGLLHLLRKEGNKALHDATVKFSREDGIIAINALFVYFDWIDQCYGSGTQGRSFSRDKISSNVEPNAKSVPQVSDQPPQVDEQTKERLITTKRKQISLYKKPRADQETERQTRKRLIDSMLMDSGWKKNVDWLEEYELQGMPNASEVGFADYVLFDNDGKALAVIEAKKTSVSVEAGREQAQIYADLLEKKFGQKPVVFLSNGYETRIFNDGYPERAVSGIYSKLDLQKVLFKRNRADLKLPLIDEAIVERYYQKAAIQAVCQHFSANHRKALLVMATGSGKTRTFMALLKVLIDRGWVKNTLFLADRTSLVRQAYNAARNHLPDVSITNLTEANAVPSARLVFSTYQTMIGKISGSDKDENGGKLYSCGHFDLIVCDEAHRSIYKKYQDIFTYFDSLLLGMTATPKEEIDKNTFEIFDLPNGDPTYNYDLAEAVRDGFLVPYRVLQGNLKFLREGIKYRELSQEDRDFWDDTFLDDAVEEEKKEINPSAINHWLFNEDTIAKALDCLREQGIRVDYGNTLGKTIIFARNHRHAEHIRDIFLKKYPHRDNRFCSVIDNQIKYNQKLIDDFSTASKLPQIAVSVDMLDTGIDVPECVNLVFFKPVYSKAKFWQMIGRGTRLCKELIDGQDKTHFLIFDFCSNFEYFEENPNGREATVQKTLSERLFTLQASIIQKLQEVSSKENDEIRAKFIAEMVQKVKDVPKDVFPARLHLKFLEQYSQPSAYLALDEHAQGVLAEHVAPYILPVDDDASSARFDALMYALESICLDGQNANIAKNKVVRIAQSLLGILNIPEVKEKEAFLRQACDRQLLDECDINDLERLRQELRSLAKYLEPKEKRLVFTNFEDELTVIPKETGIVAPVMESYRARVERYIHQHKEDGVIGKIYRNEILTDTDLQTLESELIQMGSKEDYSIALGAKPLGVFIREVNGLDVNAAKAAFSKYLNDREMNLAQIDFVNKLIDYIVKNGLIEDKKVLLEKPFSVQGLTKIFPDQTLFMGIRKVIDDISARAYPL